MELREIRHGSGTLELEPGDCFTFARAFALAQGDAFNEWTKIDRPPPAMPHYQTFAALAGLFEAAGMASAVEGESDETLLVVKQEWDPSEQQRRRSCAEKGA